nr:BON domain-containing protein [Legionella jordanis]
MDRVFSLKTMAILLCSSLSFGAYAAYTNNGSSSTLTVQPNQSPPTQNQNAAQPGLNQNVSSPSSVGPGAIQLTDTALQSSVQAALGAYKDKVKVSVKNSVVYLSGQLNSDTDYEKIVALTQSTPGVGNINVDNLTVKGSSQPLTDSFLTARVKGTLIKANLMGKDLPAWSIGVETKNGQVYLSGQVVSEQEKQAIINVVKSVPGVVQVQDRMEVSGTSTTNTTSADY